MQITTQKTKHSDTVRRTSDIAFLNAVRAHYKKHGRHTLPWRKTFSPYTILVSELMLQQTQVTRVIPKYLSWMKQYPTLASLRRASLKDILVLWQGLGYQRRAKALHDIAKGVYRLPRAFQSLTDLPGIGPYTASAMMAFAYNTSGFPLIETNIRTALIEHFHQDKEGIADPLLESDLRRLEMYKEVKQMGARQFYLALMDYGAHLKSHAISHNTKTKGYTKQSAYEGSTRQLRARILFAVTHGEKLPVDERTEKVLAALVQEGYILKKKNNTLTIA